MPSHPTHLNALSQLVNLKNQAVADILARVNYQRQLCQRYRNNIQGLNRLLSFTVPMTTPLQRDNQQRYKQALLQVTGIQQRELNLAEGQLASIEQELMAAVLNEKRLARVLELKLADWRQSLSAQEQKLQDGLANQAWWRQQGEAQAGF